MPNLKNILFSDELLNDILPRARDYYGFSEDRTDVEDLTGLFSFYTDFGTFIKENIEENFEEDMHIFFTIQESTDNVYTSDAILDRVKYLIDVCVDDAISGYNLNYTIIIDGKEAIEDSSKYCEVIGLGFLEYCRMLKLDVNMYFPDSMQDCVLAELYYGIDKAA